MTTLATLNPSPVTVYEAVETASKIATSAVHAAVAANPELSKAQALARIRATARQDVLAIAATTGKGLKAAVNAVHAHAHAAAWDNICATYADNETRAGVARCAAVQSVSTYLSGMTVIFSVRNDGARIMKRADWVAALGYASTLANKRTSAGKPAAGSKDAAAALQVLNAWDARIEAARAAATADATT